MGKKEGKLGCKIGFESFSVLLWVLQCRKSFSFHLNFPGRICTDVSREPHQFLTSRHNRYKQRLGDGLAQSLFHQKDYAFLWMTIWLHPC